MSHAVTAVPKTPEISAPPFVSRDTIELMRSQQRELLRHPERQAPAADLNRGERYIFRTYPGTCPTVVHSVWVRPDKDTKRAEFYQRRWEHYHGGEDGEPTDASKAERRRLADIAERARGATITFTGIPNHRECYYATDDAVLAAYLRNLVDIKKGEFAHVYEESGRTRLVHFQTGQISA